MNWGLDTNASSFLFDLYKKLRDEKTITKSDVQGLAFFIGKVIVLEDAFEKQQKK